MLTRMLSTKTSITLYLLSPSPQEGDRQSAATCQVSGCRAGECGDCRPPRARPASCVLYTPLAGPSKAETVPGGGWAGRRGPSPHHPVGPGAGHRRGGVGDARPGIAAARTPRGAPSAPAAAFLAFVVVLVRAAAGP